MAYSRSSRARPSSPGGQVVSLWLVHGHGMIPGPIEAPWFSFLGVVPRNLDNAGELSEAVLAPAVRAGLDAIVDLGGAKVGACTVVDAIDPATRALEDGGSLADAARAAPPKGAEATADAAAAKGRASSVGDAAKGGVDPGALISWFFGALAG